MPATLKAQRYPRQPDLVPGTAVTVAHDDGPVDVVVTWAQDVREGGQWVHGTADTKDVVWWATW